MKRLFCFWQQSLTVIIEKPAFGVENKDFTALRQHR